MCKNKGIWNFVSCQMYCSSAKVKFFFGLKLWSRLYSTYGLWSRGQIKVKTNKTQSESQCTIYFCDFSHTLNFCLQDDETKPSPKTPKAAPCKSSNNLSLWSSMNPPVPTFLCLMTFQYLDLITLWIEAARFLYLTRCWRLINIVILETLELRN